MKKVFSIFLCLAMLLSTVALFASCQKSDGTPKVSAKVINVDLTEYAVVYASDMSAEVKNHATDAATALSAVTAIPFRPIADEETATVLTETKEILIGHTNREETVKALNSVGEVGWTIRVFENKIVIVGTTGFLTRVALAYFVENYATADTTEGAVISLNEKVVVKNLETISLTTGEGDAKAGAYSVVYDDRLDDKVGSGFGSEPAGETVDYPVVVATDIRADLGNAVELRSSSFAAKKDTDEPSEFEVLVGNQDRTEMKAILSRITADEYAVSVENGKIVVAAWNDMMLKRAYGLFQSLLEDSVGVNKDGEEVLMIPANCYLKQAAAGSWITNFPRPTGDNISLVTTQDVADGAHLYVYGGEGATKEAYDAYCAVLEKSKFSKHGPETTMEGSYFRTYYSNSANIHLTVSYFDYKHAEAQGVDNFTKGIRIVAAPLDTTELVDTDYYNPSQAYQRLTDTMVTSIKLNQKIGAFGMSYVITLEDGSFIVYDGGGVSEGTTDDHTMLYNVLTDLYKKSHEGVAPSADEPIHIRSWILTHEHTDHFMVFREFCEKYGQTGMIRLDMLLANFASKTEVSNVYNPQSVVQDNLVKHQEWVKGGFKYIKVHTGQTFYMANAKLECLYTHEDVWPQRLEYFNNTSTVFRVTLDDTNGKGIVNKSTTMVFLGDLERVGSKCMRAMHGTTLDADMVQVAHHGWNGVEAELYDLISPEVVWFPYYKSQYTASTNPNKTEWFYKVNYHLLCEITSVKIIIMADTFNTTIRITENGPQYDEEDLMNAYLTDTVKYTANVIVRK